MSDSVIDMAPVLASLLPIITPVAVAVVGAFVGLAAAAFTKLTGVKINAIYLGAAKSAAETEAGKIVAGAADNFATRQIDVGSPIVAAAANAVALRIPAVMKATGLTPEALASMIVGEIGSLQATMTLASPAASRGSLPAPIPASS